jgi:hypothetical protein
MVIDLPGDGEEHEVRETTLFEARFEKARFETRGA